MLPLLLIVNVGTPACDALKRSPTPLLSTTKLAKEVLPETEAAAVVPPPMVRVAFFRDWIVESPPRVTPVPVVAETEAKGVAAPLIPVTANLAEEVEVPPRRKSRTDANFGAIIPPSTFQLEPIVVQ